MLIMVIALRQTLKYILPKEIRFWLKRHKTQKMFLKIILEWNIFICLYQIQHDYSPINFTLRAIRGFGFHVNAALVKYNLVLLCGNYWILREVLFSNISRLFPIETKLIYNPIISKQRFFSLHFSSALAIRTSWCSLFL